MASESDTSTIYPNPYPNPNPDSNPDPNSNPNSNPDPNPYANPNPNPRHPYENYCKPVAYQTAFSITPSANAAMTYSMCQVLPFGF